MAAHAVLLQYVREASGMINKLLKGFAFLVNAVSVISYAGIFFIMVLIVVDVIFRFCAGTPILGSYEIVERIEMCAVLASFAYTNTERAHVHVVMLIMLFPHYLRLFFYGVTELLSGVIMLLVAYAATIQANMASVSNYTTGVLFIRLAPFYWIESVCMFIFAMSMFIEAIRSLVGIFKKGVADEIEASWS